MLIFNNENFTIYGILYLYMYLIPSYYPGDCFDIHIHVHMYMYMQHYSIIIKIESVAQCCVYSRGNPVQ